MPHSWGIPLTIPSIEDSQHTERMKSFPLEFHILPVIILTASLTSIFNGCVWAMLSPGQVSLLKAKTGSTLHWKCAMGVPGAEMTSIITRSDVTRNLTGASIQSSCKKGFPFQKDSNKLSLIQWRLHPCSACPGVTEVNYRKSLRISKRTGFCISYIFTNDVEEPIFPD